jgi:hypothetical protein
MAFEISYGGSFDHTNTNRYLSPFDSSSVYNLVNDYEDIKWHTEMMQLFVLGNLAEVAVLHD